MYAYMRHGILMQSFYWLFFKIYRLFVTTPLDQIQILWK